MKSRMLLLLVVLICFVSLLHAQQQSQTQTATQSPSITAAEPPSVDNQGIKNYLLGPGDVLDVRVFGQPDLGAMVDVDPSQVEAAFIMNIIRFTQWPPAAFNNVADPTRILIIGDETLLMHESDPERLHQLTKRAIENVAVTVE